MSITKESYWSVQHTEDGRSWNEIFQINDPQNEIDEDRAFTLATEAQSSILQYPQFYRLRIQTRKVLNATPADQEPYGNSEQLEAKDYLKTKKIWLGTKVADMNAPENYFELEHLLEDYHQAKLKL